MTTRIDVLPPCADRSDSITSVDFGFKVKPKGIESGDDLPARPKLDALPQVQADERVMNELQPDP
jgi:hypothetical protein